jgi:hypothetical protein
MKAFSDYTSETKSSKKLNDLLGKTFTVKWKGSDFTQTFRVDQSSISGAAHLVGEGSLAKALEELHEKAYDKTKKYYPPR